MDILKNSLKSAFNGIVKAFNWYHNSLIETDKMMDGLDPKTKARIYASMYPFRRW